MSEEEFNLLPFNKLDAYLNFVHSKHPFHRPRYSEHTYLNEHKQKDPVLAKNYDRLDIKTDINYNCCRGYVVDVFIAVLLLLSFYAILLCLILACCCYFKVVVACCCITLMLLLMLLLLFSIIVT